MGRQNISHSPTPQSDCQNHRIQKSGMQTTNGKINPIRPDYEQQAAARLTGQCSQQTDQDSRQILNSVPLQFVQSVSNDAVFATSRGSAKLHNDFFHAFIGGILQIFHAVVAHSDFALFFGQVRDSCAQFPLILSSGHRFTSVHNIVYFSVEMLPLLR